MNKQQLDKYENTLHIAEGKLNTYWKFDNDSPIKITEQDTLVGLCKEVMSFDAECNFRKLQYEYQLDIVNCLIEQKKKEGDFTYIKDI